MLLLQCGAGNTAVRAAVVVFDKDGAPIRLSQITNFGTLFPSLPPSLRLFVFLWVRQVVGPVLRLGLLGVPRAVRRLPRSGAIQVSRPPCCGSFLGFLRVTGIPAFVTSAE